MRRRLLELAFNYMKERIKCEKCGLYFRKNGESCCLKCRMTIDVLKAVILASKVQYGRTVHIDIDKLKITK